MPKNNFNQWSLTLLRVVLGIIYTYHGYAKLFLPGGFKGTVGFFTAINIPMAAYSAILVSLVEFAGGLFLVFGVLTKWAAFALLIEMTVALFKVHIKSGFFISHQAYGYEYLLLLLAALTVVLVNGSGKLSIGKLLKNKYLQ